MFLKKILRKAYSYLQKKNPCLARWLSSVVSARRRYGRLKPIFWIIFKNSLVSRVQYGRFQVTEEDWDYLIILDTCRLDSFKKLNNNIPGRLERRFSQGSCTGEWLMRNFFHSRFEDIVYISGNPNVSNVISRVGVSNPFFRLERVWKWGWSWDQDLKITHPSSVVDSALELGKRYPEKRMIIHFLQPHSPYLDVEGTAIQRRGNPEHLAKEMQPHEVKRMYEDNLGFVLKHVYDLIANLDGRIIISADHGEALGECGLWAHPFGVHIRPLVEVPWFIVGDGAKKSERTKLRQKMSRLRTERKI